MRRYAGVIATSGDAVLLVREPRGEGGALLWGIPSGTVEDGETFAAGAARELAEEAGLHMDAHGLVEIARVELRMVNGVESDAVTFAIEVERHVPVVDDPDRSVLEAAWLPIEHAIRLVSASEYLSMVEPQVHFLRTRTRAHWRYTDPRLPGVRSSEECPRRA